MLFTTSSLRAAWFLGRCGRFNCLIWSVIASYQQSSPELNKNLIIRMTFEDNLEDEQVEDNKIEDGEAWEDQMHF